MINLMLINLTKGKTENFFKINKLKLTKEEK